MLNSSTDRIYLVPSTHYFSFIQNSNVYLINVILDTDDGAGAN